jgi:long-subunit acyl-CoA synthetase (AMP-forming)
MSYDMTYGLSDGGGPGVTHLSIENERKIRAIVKPSIIWDVRVVRNDGADVNVDEVGKIIVKGSCVMKGYYKNPEATAKIVCDGWLHIGDH